MELLAGRIESIDENVKEILVQTTKTNGRVNTHDRQLEQLQRDVKGLEASKNITKGRDKAVWVMLTVVGIIIGYFIQNFLTKH